MIASTNLSQDKSTSPCALQNNSVPTTYNPRLIPPQIPEIPSPTILFLPNPHSNTPLLPHCQPENNHPIRRQHTQSHRNRLHGPNRARDRTPTQHGRGKQTDLLTVGLACAQTHVAEEIERTDGEARDDRGDGACAGEADGAAEGGEEGEDDGGVGGEVGGGGLVVMRVSIFIFFLILALSFELGVSWKGIGLEWIKGGGMIARGE